MLLGKALLTTTLAVLAVAPSSAQPWESSELILWKDESRREALFVPAEMLPQEESVVPIDQAILRLPLNAEMKKELARSLGQARQRSGTGQARLSLPQGLDSSLKLQASAAESLLATLLEAPVVIRGRVVQVVPGLSALGSLGVAQRVFVEVDERLVGTGIGPRSTLSTVQLGGTLRLGGVELVNSSDDGSAPSFKLGDRVLISGWMYQGSTTFLMTSSGFQVEGDQLKAVGYSSKSSPLTLGLQQVRARLAGIAGANP
jgi:hypothetical protein